MTTRSQSQISWLASCFIGPRTFATPEPGCRQAPVPALTCLPSSDCQWFRLQICLYLEEQVCGSVLNQVSTLLASSWCISYSWNDLIWKRATSLRLIRAASHMGVLCSDFCSFQILFTLPSSHTPARFFVLIHVFWWEKESEALSPKVPLLGDWVTSYLCYLGMIYHFWSSVSPSLMHHNCCDAQMPPCRRRLFINAKVLHK